MAKQTTTQHRLIKLQEVVRVTGKSRSAIYNDPSFPRPIKIGPRASAWIEAEVFEWIESRIAQRAQG